MQTMLTVQRSKRPSSTGVVVRPMIRDVLRSPGQPLDANTRGFMESRFGHNFGDVRVHTDARAAESAQAVNALAYTVGRDVVFDAGQYAPSTSTGQRLIAHELTHTLQQRHTDAPSKFEISRPGDPSEQKADVAARAVMRGESVRLASGSARQLARQTAPQKDDSTKKPDEKKVITQPPPQKIPADQAKKKDAEPAKAKGDEEKKGVEGAASVGVETETKREEGQTKTEVAGKYSFELTIPITDKLKLGPVSFLKEAGVQASAGLKSSESKRGALTNLELETTVKVISVEWENVKVPLGVADFGISGSALASAEYSPMEQKGGVKFGVAGEAEAKFKRTEKSPFFIKVSGGVEKTYDKEGNADFKWGPVAWKTSASVGVEF